MKIALSLVAAISLVLINIMPVYAETFKTETFVEADDAGVVTIKGGEGIVALTQYCPDEWRDGC
jgi:hypothetical protein